MRWVCVQRMKSRQHFGLPHSQKARKTLDIYIGGSSTKFPECGCHSVLTISPCIKLKMLSAANTAKQCLTKGASHVPIPQASIYLDLLCYLFYYYKSKKLVLQTF